MLLKALRAGLGKPARGPWLQVNAGACIAVQPSSAFGSAADRDRKAGLTHYERLGVPRNASTAEIKAAFRKRAKLLHPDTAASDSTADFAPTLLAYQVLTDARERVLYDLSIDVRGFPASSRPNDGQDFDLSWVREGTWAAWAAAAPRPVSKDSAVDHLRANLKAELRSALRHAYLGPELDLEAGQLPEYFEGEERSDPAATDLLQLVSGRSLLGAVRERSTKQLPGPVAAAIEAASQPPDGAGRAGGAGAPERSILDLEVGGRLAAVGVREWRPGLQRRTLFLAADGSAMAEERGGALCKMESGAGTEEAWQPRHEVLRATTPFVRHLHFVAVQGGARISICRCRRARLPPPAWWLFPPRSQQHCGRSWHFQWAGHSSAGHPLWLPPAVFLLTAAFEGLEDERRAAAREGLLLRAASWARRVLRG